LRNAYAFFHSDFFIMPQEITAFRIEDLKICGGPSIQEGDTVTLLYRVALSEKDLDEGRLLESNHNPETPIEILLKRDELLEGVFRGLLGMKAGGSIRRLFLPPDCAYGERSWGPVPAGSSLVVDVVVSLVTRTDGQECEPSLGGA
jgi:FKBP-type peptidyl-prolyl cis-trans isomerase FkpA